MFARVFSLGIISSLFATILSVVYTSFYTNVIVDFSEVASIIKILAYNVMIGTFASILFFGIGKIITNKSIATFLFNLLLSGVSIALVFYVLKSNDPTFKNEDAEYIWNKVFEAGAAFGIKPIGLAARDTLRLEMGFCLYGNDINDTTSPLEAGLGWITKFTKEFTNSENLKAQKEAGISRKLVGFELIDRGIPRHDYEIVDAEGNNIGIVTSGTQAPSLGKAIGMGYVKTEFAAADSEIYIEIRDKKIAAKVVKMPFYKK
jgi:hypothetical protein